MMASDMLQAWHDGVRHVQAWHDGARHVAGMA